MLYDFPDTNLLGDTLKKKKSNVVDDVFTTLELLVVQTVSVIQDSNQNILDFEPTTEQTISVHPKNIEKNTDKTLVAASKMYLFVIWIYIADKNKNIHKIFNHLEKEIWNKKNWKCDILKSKENCRTREVN